MDVSGFPISYNWEMSADSSIIIISAILPWLEFVVYHICRFSFHRLYSSITSFVGLYVSSQLSLDYLAAKHAIVFNNQDIYTSQRAVARYWFNEGRARWLTGESSSLPHPLFFLKIVKIVGIAMIKLIWEYFFFFFFYHIVTYIVMCLNRSFSVRGGQFCWICTLRCSGSTSILHVNIFLFVLAHS